MKSGWSPDGASVARWSSRSVPVLDDSVLARGYRDQGLETAHVVALFRVIRCLHVTRGEARVMTGLQCVGVLLCCLHVHGNRCK